MLQKIAWVIAAAAIGTIVRQGIWKATESPRPLVPQHSSSSVLSRFPARVNAVFDGDTVVAIDATGVEHRIRFSGVDAPELAHDGRPAQPGGQEALHWLRGKIQGQVVVVEVVDRDKWGREVARISVDGEDINLALIRNGLAWAYRQYLRDTYRGPYIVAEEAARSEGRGLWRDTNPTPPWDWRHQ